MTILLLGIIITLAVLHFTSCRQNKKEKSQLEDSILSRMHELIEGLLMDHERVAMHVAVTNGKLDMIYNLVENNMTRVLQADLDTSIRELALMKEVIALHPEHEYEPSDEIRIAMISTQMRIQELKVLLDDRFTKTQKEFSSEQTLEIDGVVLKG